MSVIIPNMAKILSAHRPSSHDGSLNLKFEQAGIGRNDYNIWLDPSAGGARVLRYRTERPRGTDIIFLKDGDPASPDAFLTVHFPFGKSDSSVDRDSENTWLYSFGYDPIFLIWIPHPTNDRNKCQVRFSGH